MAKDAVQNIETAATVPFQGENGRLCHADFESESAEHDMP